MMLQKGKNKELQNRLVGSGAEERGLTRQEHKENSEGDLNISLWVHAHVFQNSVTYISRKDAFY